MNRVVLAGRLTRDPELRYTPNGIPVANFTVAINRPYRNQQGEQEADFINCVTWRKQAENLANYMRKGSLIGVDGRIQTRSYENQEGRRVFVTEVLAEQITFLESKSQAQQRPDMGGFVQNDSYQQQSVPQTPQAPSYGGQGQDAYEQPDSYQDTNPFENDGEKIDVTDDDLPF